VTGDVCIKNVRFSLKGMTMSQGNFNAPPPAKSGGGMSTMMIVLIVLGVLGLVCVGACGVCSWGLMNAGKAIGGAVMAELAMLNIRQDAAVTDELGSDLTAENAKLDVRGGTTVVDFDVKGSKATGKAHAEFSGSDPNNPAAPAKVNQIKVTLPSGKVVDVSLTPKFDMQNQPPEMLDDAGNTDSTDTTDATPGDSTEM